MHVSAQISVCVCVCVCVSVVEEGKEWSLTFVCINAS